MKELNLDELMERYKKSNLKLEFAGCDISKDIVGINGLHGYCYECGPVPQLIICGIDDGSLLVELHNSFPEIYESLRVANEIIHRFVAKFDEHIEGKRHVFILDGPEYQCAKKYLEGSNLSMNNFVPTPDNINLLPEPLRKYIHDLEALCEPAGIVAENILTHDQNNDLIERLRVLEKMVDEMALNISNVRGTCPCPPEPKTCKGECAPCVIKYFKIKALAEIAKEDNDGH